MKKGNRMRSDGQPTPTLRFREDGSFRIVQFTDIHWHNGEDSDQQTRSLIERIVEAEKPDLVALTGDVIAGRHCTDPSESWRQVVVPLEERGIPWAGVFGNHDDEGIHTREQLMAAQQSCRMCLSEPGPEEIGGVGNYVLKIRPSEGDSLAAALYFMDSRSYSTIPALDGYGWFTRDQVEWYMETSRGLSVEYAASRKKETETPLPLPALAYFHIPVPEFNEVWDYHPCRGVKYEEVCSPRINTGMFAAMVEAGDVMGTFVGHDHVNDFEGNLHGIRLCYGRWTGYSTYGAERLVPGSRVVQLKEGAREFTSWLSLDDGSIIHEQPEHKPEGRRVMSAD